MKNFNLYFVLLIIRKIFEIETKLVEANLETTSFELETKYKI